MKIISHRANLDGPSPATENTRTEIEKCFSLGLDVEVDVWKVDDRLFLGHDAPQEEVSEDFLTDSRLWIHCKNIDAFISINRLGLNCFVHENDPLVLTSQKRIWLHPNVGLVSGWNHVQVLPERNLCVSEVRQWLAANKSYGICTDYPLEYK